MKWQAAESEPEALCAVGVAALEEGGRGRFLWLPSVNVIVCPAALPLASFTQQHEWKSVPVVQRLSLCAGGSCGLTSSLFLIFCYTHSTEGSDLELAPLGMPASFVLPRWI